jgi:hypothetical protein
LFIALGAGAAVAFTLNQLRPVFYTRHSVMQVAGIPVLGSVSMIMTPDDIQARRRFSLVWAGANISLLLLAVLLITFQEPVSAILRELLGGIAV